MKTVIVTGATSGIGLAVCKQFLGQSYTVIGIGRSKGNILKAEEEIFKAFPHKNVRYFCADLLRQSEIRRVSSEIGEYLNEACGGRLDVLINNAGCVRSRFTATEDGFEQQFALNHLAGFLLTHYLLPFLLKAGGCVLNTSSNSHKMMKMHWKDIMYEKKYSPLMAYKQSKLSNMLFVFALNERYKNKGLRAYGIDPGLVKTGIGEKNTGRIVKLFWYFRKKWGVSPDTAAKTYAYICSLDKPAEYLYCYLCGEKRYSRQVTKENSDRLFALSEKLCKITFGKY